MAINSIIISGIAPKQNAFKFKIAPHKQKSIVKIVLTGRGGPLTNEALCLSTPKHNGKSGTDY
jgi:1-deoxy-D-xylulose 5-phosphate reductoisomerase